MQRTGEFLADGVNNVWLAFKCVQRLSDVLPVQFSQRGVRRVVEEGSGEDALVAREVDRLQERCAVHVVGCSPRTVHPVCASLQDVVLEVVLVFQQQTDVFRLLRKLLQSPEVPLVERCQVVLAHAVPGKI